MIRHRFLYRKGICLLLGPTGVGKSSFLMQWAIYLGAGRTLFGLEPGQRYRDGMKILLIQAENDEGDLAEMRDGVLAGSTELSEVELSLLNPYLRQFAHLDLQQGRFSVNSAADLSFTEQWEPRLRITADTALKDLELHETVMGEELCSWAALNLRGISFDLDPLQVTIDDLLLDSPTARFTLTETNHNLAVTLGDSAVPPVEGSSHSTG